MSKDGKLFNFIEGLISSCSSDKISYGDNYTPEDAAYAEGIADGHKEVIHELKCILAIFTE